MNLNITGLQVEVERYIQKYSQNLYNAGVSTLRNSFRSVSDYTQSIVEHFLLVAVAYIILCATIYHFINRGHGLKFQRPFNKSKRVLLVTAHPDDECMFFGPTIYNLTHETKCSVYLLCLSTGNKDGLGKARKFELWNACKSLGIQEANIQIYNCDVLQDDPTKRWPEDFVAKIISHNVESLGIDTLLTFDKHGVSRHNNHASIYYAIAYLTMENKLPKSCKVFTLESINLLRKYWLIFDIPISYIFSTHRFILKWSQRSSIIDAMKEHRSQFVWFRRLYVKFSRYMIINTFQQLDTIDLELDLTLDD